MNVTITATKDALESIGIDYAISGLIGIVTGYYPSGYVCVEVTHKLGNFEFTNEFDIPKYYLNFE